MGGVVLGDVRNGVGVGLGVWCVIEGLLIIGRLLIVKVLNWLLNEREL